MELPEAVTAAAGRRASGPALGGAVGASILARVSAGAAAAARDFGAAQGRAVDRRDRQARRGVRGLPARTTLRFPGERARTRHRARARAPGGSADLQPRARVVGRVAP